jgi:transmembrane sensor
MSTDHHDLDPSQREAHEWLARFMRGDATAADLEAIKSWYAQSPEHAAAYARARRLWRTLGPVTGSSRERASEALAKRHRGISRRGLLGGALTASAAVAGCALLDPPFGLWPSFAQLTADYHTATGEQRQFHLADAVSLDLNTQTSIAIRRAPDKAQRIELISGEAVVSVADVSRPVVVSAAGGVTTATNAKFNLRYVGNEGCLVTCIEGGVTVETNGSTAALAPRQQVSYRAHDIGNVSTIDPEAVLAWQKGLLVFEFTPVARAIEEVNRYRPGRIVLLNDAIGRRVLNARFPIAEADKIVGQIVRIFGAKAVYLPAGLVVLT